MKKPFLRSRKGQKKQKRLEKDISISCGNGGKLSDQFQPTLPVWGATYFLYYDNITARISIHAPRVGSDPTTAAIFPHSRYFNPRSPCGERHVSGSNKICNGISIHAPRVGSDPKVVVALKRPKPYFNPRSPCGERRQSFLQILLPIPFQSTLPVWGATVGPPAVK